LAHATSETRVPAVDAARVDVADASGLRSWAVTARGRTLHQVVTLGEGGVTLERPPDEAPILRAHVLVQPTDEAIAPAQSPRIQVDLAEPLPPGGYRIEVCLQEIRALPRDEGPPQVLRLDATAT
jgi:hypothetical protein